MRLLTMRRQIHLRDLDSDAPSNEVQYVLHHLAAGPLITASDREIHDHDAERFSCDAVTGNPVVALAGSRLGPSHKPRDHGRVSLDRVLEGAGRPGHG